MLRPQQNKKRELHCLDGIWDFQLAKGDGIEKRLFNGLTHPRKIGVPGSWNEQLIDSYLHFDEGWYEKRFIAPDSYRDKRVMLYFGSVCQNAVVWLNGIKLGEHIGPHLPFEYDVTKQIRVGEENRIVVLADGTLDTEALPPASMSANDLRTGWSKVFPATAYDFFPFSGIHRPVYIYTTDNTFIADVHVKTTPSDSSATVCCNIKLSGDVSGKIQIIVEGQTHTLSLMSESTIENLSFEIRNPRIWDIGKGELYDLEIQLFSENTLTDCYRVRFGIRSIKVENNQFLLNGKPVVFKGFGKHEDFDVIGKGLSTPLIIRDYDLLEWIGANSFRTSHYPYASEWLDVADEKGVLVISETPFVGLNARLYKEDILNKALRVLEEFIVRDRNHPSVVMWSLANEPNSSGSVDTKDKYDACMRFYSKLVETTKRLDSTRPVTYAAHSTPTENPMAQLFDVLCINKYYGWYECLGHIDESVPYLINELEGFYEKYHKPIILAEFGADCIHGEHQIPEVMFTEEFQSKIIETQIDALKEKPWMIGFHVWNFADFKVGQSLGRMILNRKGVFTRARQPKMAAHTLRRLWKAYRS
jgi:beta-glucuronidase